VCGIVWCGVLHFVPPVGDVDGCVPYNDNEAWTSGMGYPVASPWHPWLLDNQVAGYATVYTPPTASAKFQFVTVKGSGHMVRAYSVVALAASAHPHPCAVGPRTHMPSPSAVPFLLQVPQYQPAFALQMLTQFLTGTPF
jgi:hypothetical protein